MRRPILALALLLAAAPFARAQSVADFYRGKTIRLIIGAAVGGGYDIPGRVVASHMARHVPGNPAMVVENMPGATSLIMTNYLFVRAPRDGTAIGMPNNSVPFEPQLKILSREGGNVAFDLAKFSWIGSPLQEPQALFVMSAAARTIDDLRARKTIVASTGTSADNYVMPYMLNQLAGTKMDFVTGYQGQGDIFLALERGEAHANSAGVSNFFVTKPDWLRDGRVAALVQFGDARLPELKDVPTAMEIAPDPASREALRFFAQKFKMARPLVLPPDVPADRVAALREAFVATMKDPAFLAEAKKTGLEINPVTGPQIEAILASIFSASPDVVERLRDLLARAGGR